MRKILLAGTCALIMLGGFVILPAKPAQARDYPVCSYGSGGGVGGGATRCEFENYDQCRASTSGSGGSCSDNPQFDARARQLGEARAQQRRIRSSR